MDSSVIFTHPIRHHIHSAALEQELNQFSTDLTNGCAVIVLGGLDVANGCGVVDVLWCDDLCSHASELPSYALDHPPLSVSNSNSDSNCDPPLDGIGHLK